MHNFKELKVWQKSIDLAVEVYKATSLLPNEERFGLISQMKRCSVSISSNIAEGSGRGGGAQFKYFLNISQGSAFELETQLIISNRLELLDDELSADLIEKTTEIQKMVYALDRSIKV
ncbi:four helix bundle protein [Pedobacter sp. ISL-68]|uniref:four helix bundle protein n=1 Tax=unclassified Pedobacter TaxID=2628915 RepID=UPI001BE7F2AB|nr:MULTISPECIES: four helix bundle protein [unclassified Pedobacter]MBT2561837.1 four helix bundle protein [Pedobacter sp. ISL-64]MBT2592495.1 four helix bundle protein [Pedobacter sp. ISL-68]